MFLTPDVSTNQYFYPSMFLSFDASLFRCFYQLIFGPLNVSIPCVSNSQCLYPSMFQSFDVSIPRCFYPTIFQLLDIFYPWMFIFIDGFDVFTPRCFYPSLLLSHDIISLHVSIPRSLYPTMFLPLNLFYYSMFLSFDISAT